MDYKRELFNLFTISCLLRLRSKQENWTQYSFQTCFSTRWEMLIAQSISLMQKKKDTLYYGFCQGFTHWTVAFTMLYTCALLNYKGMWWCKNLVVTSNCMFSHIFFPSSRVMFIFVNKHLRPKNCKSPICYRNIIIIQDKRDCRRLRVDMIIV